MRSIRRSFAVLVALVTLAGAASGQDFDPKGRHKPGKPGKPPAGQPGKPPAGQPGKPPVGQPTAPKPPAQPEQQAGVLIERYTRIVLSQPGAPFPLQRLAQLYREKDGNLAGLVKDFEARAAVAGDGQYAAVVTLAGIYKTDGRADDAVKTYERAIALKGNDPVALLALARLLQDRGDVTGARTRYEEALALQTVPADKQQTIRTLMTLSLDAKDWAKSKEYHDKLVKLDANNLFVRAELGRELYSRGEYERAEAELKEVVQHAAGDNRTLAPALKDLGKAQAKAHKNPEALATLKKALQAAGSEAAVRAEIYETITEIYRADQQLPMLIKQLEDEHPTDFARLALLGGLYEETGDATNALATYRKALAVNPRHIDLRLKVIRVLQSQGELDKAITEYEGLIRAAPNNPQFVFEHCDALMQRGDRPRARKHLTELEARATSDEEVLARRADIYGRIGENDRSLRVLQRLTQVAGNDPAHLVDLGDRYFQEGNVPLAVQTWKRILTTVSPRARALAALGDVYLEHDMPQDALAAFKEAVQLEPGTLAYKKQLASAYERQRSYRDARALWQELSEKAKQSGDKILAREARGRIVTLWSLERVLDAQVGPLTAAFGQTPPDLEAGRTLAEVQLHMRRLADAEGTLKRILEKAPGDADSYLGLERVLVQQNKIAEAITVLEKLLAVEPKRARELYQRMAQYALQIYRDDDAVKYAARAVELNPDDAEGHRRLGEMYRSRQDTDRAILEFRAAIQKNDRLFVVYFELADLLLSKGQTDEADRLFRRVVRGAPDEELVARAARLSMQINLGKGTLESLEQELLPMAIGNPQRPIYRRLLVEIYGNLTFGLVQRVRHGTGKDAEDARAQLARIGSRAVKPLLDALADGDAGQQRIAIDVLAYVQNKNAGPPLFAYATGQGDTQMRTRAMIACGALRDPALLPKLQSVVFPRAGDKAATDDIATDGIAVAAAWGISRLGDKRAIPAMRSIAQAGTPEMRGYAILGLAALRDKGSVPLMAHMAKTLDSGTVARAAAAYSLGEMGEPSEVGTLLGLAEGTDRLPREAALIALARMGAAKGDPPGGKAALGAMADAVFAGGEDGARQRGGPESLRRAGATALVILATRNAADPREMLAVPDAQLDAESVLSQLTTRSFTTKDRAAAVVTHADVLQRAAQSALTTSADRAHATLDALGAADGDLAPLLGTDTPETAQAREKARQIARALEPSIVPLVRHPEPTLRTKAIVVLARSSSDEAAGALATAIADPNESVQRVALSAVGRTSDPKTVEAAGKVAERHENWAIRLLAVQALGRLGAKGNGPAAAKYLQHACSSKESYALVREAALRSLAAFDAKSARSVAEQMLKTEPEPRVKQAAREIIGAP
ncbi:MAG: HEAT repeat domain-containing protein [Myxococcales bacterium]|nr:HEAT repeat domain-containing protein [Myxococcales bacterium]